MDEPVGAAAGPVTGAATAVPVRASPASRAALHAVLMAMVLVVLFPVYLVFVSAISDPGQLNQVRGARRLYPIGVDWGSFRQAFNEGGMARAFANSLVVATLITVAQLVTSALAAYAYVFLEFPFKRLVFTASMASLLLPMEVTLLANLSTATDLGWINSTEGLVLPFAATAFGIFLLRQGFSGIPAELHEAARLDGYGHLRFLWRFAMPLTKPIVASFVLLAALSAWGNYLWPRMIIRTGDRNTVPIALRDLLLLGADKANLGAAAVLIVGVPVVVLLVVFQRQIVRGLTAGAVKG